MIVSDPTRSPKSPTRSKNQQDSTKQQFVTHSMDRRTQHKLQREVADDGDDGAPLLPIGYEPSDQSSNVQGRSAQAVVPSHIDSTRSASGGSTGESSESSETPPGAVFIPPPIRVTRTTSLTSNSSSVSEEAKEEDDDDDDEGELVVAAQLSDDVEQEMEARIRQQIMNEAIHASIVATGQAEVARAIAPVFSTGVVQAGMTLPQRSVCARKLLPWRVERERVTMKWVSTVQTDPQARSKSSTEQRLTERSFVASSEREATEIALAMATPVPHSVDPIQEHCSSCQSTFTIFQRRRQFCVNCGRGNLCQGCSTAWHKAMVPFTYYCSSFHAKSMVNQNAITVCTACDWSAKHFQQALLRGDMKEARGLHIYQNVNLRTPYYFLNKPRKEVL